MSGGIEWKIEDIDTGRIRLRLDAFPREIQQQLKQTIGRLTQQLLVAVKAAQPVRTGALRQATHSFVDEGIKAGAPWVRGRVRVLGGKANLGARFGALEYGGPGRRGTGKRVEVKAYSRGGVRVRNYKRRPPTMREMRFLRGPAAARRAFAVAELEAALNAAIANFNKS